MRRFQKRMSHEFHRVISVVIGEDENHISRLDAITRFYCRQFVGTEAVFRSGEPTNRKERKNEKSVVLVAMHSHQCCSERYRFGDFGLPSHANSQRCKIRHCDAPMIVN